ncbi:AAA family ATPase [Paenimyroides baculatum]|uniref:ATP-binding protein n=1 Tax=Paenimyroides baculatum TaxID=2608000 RepID=A0A5M6CSB2_9FLAO|nr:AAA family ATPase [Paenimyroides baculatum]KAA5536029.1 ATP-binding protein [Paenimyroides baculatum]
MNTKNNTFDLHLISENSHFIGHTFSSYFLINDNEHANYLPNTNNINIFIGSNNSGKSRFMRELIKMEEWYFSAKFINKVLLYNNLIKDLYSLYQHNIERYYKLEDFQFDYKSLINTDLEIISTKSKISSFPDLYTNNKIITFLKEISNSLPQKITVKKIFIPTLRTAHSLINTTDKKIEEDFFQQTILKNYKFKLDIHKVQIFTGLHLYKEILNARNSTKDKRVRFESFEKFISENFFNRKTVDIVAEYNFDSNSRGENSSNNIIIHIDGEADRKLYELGDGIQALILLMFPIFMAEEGAYIFIDEPEINLHPGIQRLFLDQISNNKTLREKNLKYFISTHSNHFLDLTIKKDSVSIYSFSQRKNQNGNYKQFEIRNINQGDNSILKEIGVNNSSVFLANCSIWVEGVSDRNYIKAFLKAYIDDTSNKAEILKEDIDFAFFEYAGSNIDHYIFEPLSSETEEDIKKNINALALNNKIFLVADSDNASGETLKATRLNKLKENLNIKTNILTNIREIENILPTDIWTEAIDFYCNSSLIRKNEVEATDKIKKSLNKIKPEDYKKKYIGEFLNDLRNDVGKDGKEYFINKSVYKTNNSIPGTLVNKRGLSELVLDKNISWDIYKKSKEIVNLTTSIYKFIKENKI